jgi:hypothetical protein
MRGSACCGQAGNGRASMAFKERIIDERPFE